MQLVYEDEPWCHQNFFITLAYPIYVPSYILGVAVLWIYWYLHGKVLCIVQLWVRLFFSDYCHGRYVVKTTFVCASSTSFFYDYCYCKRCARHEHPLISLFQVHHGCNEWSSRFAHTNIELHDVAIERLQCICTFRLVVIKIAMFIQAPCPCRYSSVDRLLQIDIPETASYCFECHNAVDQPLSDLSVGFPIYFVLDALFWSDGLQANCITNRTQQ